MPMSTDVNLPKAHAACFPDKCILCGTPAPGNRVRLVTGSIGWWTWIFWAFGKPVIVSAPSCTLCGWQLQLRRLAGLLVTVGLIYFAYSFVWPLVDKDIPRLTRKWIMMGLGLACLLPQILYEMFVPAVFSITAFKDSIDYEFRDEEQAQEFAAHNEDAEWVRIS